MFTVEEVMVRAGSDATKAATSPTSANVAVRFSRAAFSIPATMSSRPAKLLWTVSGTPPVLMVTKRTPWGPSSQAHCRRRLSTASNATHRPPSSGTGSERDEVERDIDAPCPLRNRVDEGFNRLFVECIDDAGLG